MFVAGGLIWANVLPKVEYFEGEGSIVYGLMRDHDYGWPSTWHVATEETRAIGVVEKSGKIYIAQGDINATNPNFHWQKTYWIGLTINSFVGLAICSFVAFVCERRISRREARKP